MRVWWDMFEAQKWVAAQGYPNLRAFQRDTKCPEDIPTVPSEVYGQAYYEAGGDTWWLGRLGAFTRQWSSNALIAYLRDIHSQIDHLDPSELYHILNEAGAFPAIMAFSGAKAPMAALKALAAMSIGEMEEQIRRKGDAGYKKTNVDALKDAPEDRDTISSEYIRALDELHHISGETLTVMVERRVNQLWALAVRARSPQPALALLKGKGGRYFNEIKRRFKTEYTEVSKLVVPEGYAFRVNGRLTQPNLMQKRVAWLVRERRNVGNWSGTGAGKTNSAILASRVIGANLTVVVVANSTVEGWGTAILGMYPESHVAYSIGELRKKSRIPQYLVLNYERFQTASRQTLVQEIVALKPDFIVLDEIQYIKRRGGQSGSTRRGVLHRLVHSLPRAAVLGMTATPVINDLSEPKAMLETILRADVDAETQGTQQNALRLHYLMERHGVRFKSEHEQELKFISPKATHNSLIPKLKAARSALDIEKTLLRAKLDLVRPKIKKGTIIYVEFVQGVVPTVRKYIEGLGLTVGEFTGVSGRRFRDEDKKAFIVGDLDVLLASSAIKVGVDGLQRRANRLILLGTPWTAADLDQVVGRVHRQGSLAKSVEVVHPQITVTIGRQSWSWDALRMDAIHAKRTLADTVLDGVLANTERVSKKELTDSALMALRGMLKSLDRRALLKAA